MKPMLTTVEVAAWLGYSAEKVRRMCEDGRFDGDVETPGAFRDCVGAHWRVPREAVELFLKQRVKRRPPTNPK